MLSVMSWKTAWGTSKPQRSNKGVIASRKGQAACKGPAGPAGTVLLETSLVLMLPASSNATSDHCDTHLICQVEEAEPVPARSLVMDKCFEFSQTVPL